MIKVLILTHDFPPLNTIGAQRPYSWYNYFKENNLHPIVITKKWNTNESAKNSSHTAINDPISIEETSFGTIIRTSYQLNLRDKLLLKYGKNRYAIIRKLLTLFYSIFSFYSFKLDNNSSIYYAAKEYLKKNKIDYIIATSEPFILYRYAYKLNKKFNIPWIADYRDGWTTNYKYKMGNSIIENVLQKYFFRSFEKKIINSASILTTVSHPIKKDLMKIHNCTNVHIINNGFNEDLINIEFKPQNKEYLEIAYGGTIYPYQRLDIFLEGCSIFIRNHQTLKFKIVFYGLKYFPEIKDQILNHDEKLKTHLKIVPSLPQPQLIKELKRANVLLLLAGNKVDGSAAKVFEYLAVKRKIMLVINDNGSLEKIMNETNAGSICNNKDEVVNQLEKLYDEWLSSGKIKCDTHNFEKYSRKNQAKLMAELILNNVKVNLVKNR